MDDIVKIFHLQLTSHQGISIQSTSATNDEISAFIKENKGMKVKDVNITMDGYIALVVVILTPRSDMRKGIRYG